MILEGAAGMDAVDAAIELLKNTVFPSAQLGLVVVAVEALREKRARIKGEIYMSKLKPCPFCGSKDISVDGVLRDKRDPFTGEFISTAQTSFIKCKTCGAEIHKKGNAAKVIALWNTRAEVKD